jgi:DNA-binding transcriptional ArsR family regulator
MPIRSQEMIQDPKRRQLEVAMAPAVNALGSLHLLVQLDWLSGLDDWLVRTASEMSDKQRQNNRMALFGLHYAVVPTQNWPSFPAYIDHIEAIDGHELTDRLMRRYASLPLLPDAEPEADLMDWSWALESAESYLAFLGTRFSADVIDVELETQAYHLVRHPDEMKAMLVSHFRDMWTAFLEAEWERVEPMLLPSARAFQELELDRMSLEAAFEAIAQQPQPKVIEWMKDIHRVVFVPSVHTGPYMTHLVAENTAWILFSARMPTGREQEAPDLSRAELLYRLSALADDTRLRILADIRDEGELSSQDVIERMGVSQSTASRHLRQLSATGFLSERRTEAGKWYRLNGKRIELTLDALRAYLSENLPAHQRPRVAEEGGERPFGAGGGHSVLA